MKIYLELYNSLFNEIYELNNSCKSKSDYMKIQIKLKQLKEIHQLISKFITDSIDESILKTEQSISRF